MANAWCINAYDCNGCLIQTLQNLDSACIGVGVQYTAPNPLDDKRLDYIKYTDKCWCVQCLSAENEILIYATNGVIKNLTLTNDDVNEAIKIKWNDIFWSNRAKTVVRYKTWSYPTSITDGTLAVEETTKNQYSSTPFSLSGVLDETTYYITAFAVDSNNTVISSQTASVTTDFWWHPSANTLARYPLTSSSKVNDMSWNNNTMTNNNSVTFWTHAWVDSAYFSWWSSWWYLSLSKSLWTWNSQFTANVWFYKTSSLNTDWTFFSVWYPNTNQSLLTWIASSYIELWWWDLSAPTNVQCPVNSWHLLTVTFDWTTYKWYLDKTQIYSWTKTFWITNNLTVIWKSVNLSSTRPMTWYLSNMLFEKIAWTKTEIDNYYDKLKSLYGL